MKQALRLAQDCGKRDGSDWLHCRAQGQSDRRVWQYPSCAKQSHGARGMRCHSGSQPVPTQLAFGKYDVVCDDRTLFDVHRPDLRGTNPESGFGCSNPKGSLNYIEERRQELNLNHSVEVVKGCFGQRSSHAFEELFQGKRYT
ncbi:MAG: hypothetical protein R2877_00980 [Bdellovibrionota bacterium]